MKNLRLKDLERAFQRLGLTNMVQWWGGWSPFPLRITFSLTMRCNMNCAVCGQAKRRDELLAGQELSLPEWQAVVDDLARSFFFKPALYLTGGEPLLYRDIDALVQYIKAQGFRLSCTTNALLLEQHAAALVAARLNHIQVSLDGPREIHDAARGVAGAFDRAVAGIRAVIAARQDLPRVTLNCVIGPLNYPYLQEVLEIAHDLQVDAVNFQHLMFYDEDSPGGRDIDVARLLADMPTLKSRAAELGVEIRFFPHMRDETVQAYYHGTSAELKGRCIAPWFTVEVHHDGEIVTCPLRHVVGNVRADVANFSQIWNNDRFRAFRQALLAAGGVFPECARCCHRQFS